MHPTRDQVYVDAMHMKFSGGTGDFGWVGVAGKLMPHPVSLERRKKGTGAEP